MYTILYKYAPGDTVYHVSEENGITEAVIYKCVITKSVAAPAPTIDYVLTVKKTGATLTEKEESLYGTLETALVAYGALLSK